MSDGLTTTTHPEPAAAPPGPADRRVWVVAALQALAVVVAFAAAGALGGLLWFRLWDVPHGVVSGHEWYTGESGLRADFSGTGWYVVIAVLVGLVLGVLSAWLGDRSEVVILVAVVVGSVLAAYVMLQVGHHRGAPDPDVLARSAKDGTRLDGALEVHGWPARAAFPFGALVGVVLVYVSTLSRTPAEVRAEPPAGSGFTEGTRG
jgi:hypothetical protein